MESERNTEKGAAATAAIKLVKQLKGVITDLTRADVQGLHWPGQSWATKYRLINGAGGVALKRKPDAEKWLLRDMARCVYN